ncbi:MAG TPA: hypothetical protein PKJ84_03405, partial [Anaerolineales bacterium]|nr:hypothetical protein [Anaerolineales bacterium]
NSFSVYRRTRQKVKDNLAKVQKAGYDQIRIIGSGDVADICKLTCIEQGITVVTDKSAPALVLDGYRIRLEGLE